MNELAMKGAAAELRWGWHQAAVLESWEMSGATVTATVVSADDFMVTQAPLKFVVPRPSGPWVWTVSSLQITGKTFSASLVQE